MSSVEARQHVLVVGGIAALAVGLPLAARRDVRLTIIDDRPAGEHHGGEAILARDFGDESYEALESTIVAQWDAAFVPSGTRVMECRRSFALIHDAQLEAELRQRSPDLTVVRATLVEIGARHVSTKTGAFEADVIVDAREPKGPNTGAVHIQTNSVVLPRPHRLRGPVAADTETAAHAGWSFLQYIPVDPTHLQIRAIGFGRPGRAIAIAPDEGELLHAGCSCVPLFPERQRVGEAATIPFGCPDPIVPSTLPMALVAGVALAKLSWLVQANVKAILNAAADREIDRRLTFIRECEELAIADSRRRSKRIQELALRNDFSDLALA